MNVLVLHSRYLSWIASGENRVVDDETRLLHEAGHEVVLWDPPFAPDAPGRTRRGVEAIWSTEAARHIRALIREHRPDVVHAHNIFPTLSPVCLRVAAQEGVAVVMTLHNYRLMCLPGTLLRRGEICELCVGKSPWRGVRYRCLRGSLPGSTALASSLVLHRGIQSFEKVTLFLAVSEFIASKHVEAGLPAERIRVKRNFAWESPQRTGAGEYFLSIGRLSSEKGVATVLKAWSGIGAKLLVVGDGPEADRLKSAAPPGVDFTGAVSPNQVAGILTGARALVVPSEWYEPATKVVLEAYAAGVPVLASRIGGLSEVVEDDVSGYLVDAGDPDAWAAALRILEDDATSTRLGEGARRLWQEHYSPDGGLQQLEARYQEAVELSRVTGRRFGRRRP
jgi:glycosyltransferase involved in cell wall biosynthesis